MQTRDIIALGVLVVMALGLFWNATDIRDIKEDVREVRRDVIDLRERMARVETFLEQLLKKEELVLNGRDD